MEYNSLAKFLSELRDRRKQELLKLKKSGIIIAGYFCNYTPPEIVEACGAVPVRITENMNQHNETSGRQFIGRDSCSFCKAALGSLLNDSTYSCIVSGTTCDQMRRLHETIPITTGIPVFLFCNPRTFGKNSTKALFKREILWIINELNNLTKMKFSEGILFEKIKKWNALRKFLTKIHDQRKNESPPVSGTEMFQLINTAFFLGPEKFLPVIPEIEKIINRRDRYFEDTIRILLAGSIITSEEDPVLELIEEKKCTVIVSDIVCSGIRWFYFPIKENGDVLDNLCNVYHQETICPFRRPNDSFYTFTQEQISDWNPQGIIYRTLKFCHPLTFEVQTFKNRFDIPLLHIDTDFSDSNTGQLRTRIGAFLEMIRAKKEAADAVSN